MLSLYLSLIIVLVNYISASNYKLNLKVKSYKLKYYREMIASVKLLNARSTFVRFMQFIELQVFVFEYKGVQKI